MAFRLVNANNSGEVLVLTDQAWFRILELAEVYSWYLLNSFSPEFWNNQAVPSTGYYMDAPLDHDWRETDRQKIWVAAGDAAHLAEALEMAFLERDPVWIPGNFYISASADEVNRLFPAVGTLQSVIAFCRQGAFWIMPDYTRRPSI